mgnify:CR=1 FL=1|tara:strand:+ start:50 stop:493 length:444 start_codon:yes stop_codon:yes gene_type:complete
MSIKETIQNDLKSAMKARDQERVSAIRFITAAIKQREVDERKELDDTEVLAILDKQAKQRRESIEQYEKNDRAELAEKEKSELAIIQTYLPEPLSDAELEQLIKDAIATSGASDIKEMGKVMGILKPQIQGRVDMKAASGKVRALLT